MNAMVMEREPPGAVITDPEGQFVRNYNRANFMFKHELARNPHALELGDVDEAIFATIDFACARRARGAGDRQLDRRIGRKQRIDECRLARTRRRGDDQQIALM